MAKPMQLGHTNIRVSNLARSEAFYTEAIGLEVVSRRENGVNLSSLFNLPETEMARRASRPVPDSGQED